MSPLYFFETTKGFLELFLTQGRINLINSFLSCILDLVTRDANVPACERCVCKGAVGNNVTNIRV